MNVTFFLQFFKACIHTTKGMQQISQQRLLSNLQQTWTKFVKTMVLCSTVNMNRIVRRVPDFCAIKMHSTVHGLCPPSLKFVISI